jgi:hypothetical protein
MGTEGAKLDMSVRFWRKLPVKPVRPIVRVRKGIKCVYVHPLMSSTLKEIN